MEITFPALAEGMTITSIIIKICISEFEPADVEPVGGQQGGWLESCRTCEHFRWRPCWRLS
jgi:hypothetical protein